MCQRVQAAASINTPCRVQGHVCVLWPPTFRIAALGRSLPQRQNTNTPFTARSPTSRWHPSLGKHQRRSHEYSSKPEPAPTGGTRFVDCEAWPLVLCVWVELCVDFLSLCSARTCGRTGFKAVCWYMAGALHRLYSVYIQYVYTCTVEIPAASDKVLFSLLLS